LILLTTQTSVLVNGTSLMNLKEQNNDEI